MPKPCQSNAVPALSESRGIARLALCATGICVCYLYYGVLQERLFTGNDERLGPSFILVTQCVTNTAVAVLWQRLQSVINGERKTVNDRNSALPVHHRFLFFTAACYVTAMACSNEAIRFVSYPLAVLAKSCKLIPTMIVGQLVENRLYSTQEWIAALSISIGIAMFHFSRMKHISNDENDHGKYGMLLLLASLTMDGLLSSCQNVLKQERSDARPPTAVETMYYVNLYALAFLVPLSIINGQWEQGTHLLSNNSEWIWKVTLLNGSVAIGQIFIFLTLTWYSPVVTTTITTTRKFFTILLSVATFGHSFSLIQWIATGMVFFGLFQVIQVQRQDQTKSKRD